jgi:hypothetical protein
MFDASGRFGGAIAKPSAKGCVSAAFAAPDGWLYACASDKVFRPKDDDQRRASVGGQPGLLAKKVALQVGQIPCVNSAWLLRST